MCARIATTQWSQVLAARDGSDTEARAALESLCQTYWQPLYVYVRHQGHTPDESLDLTQGFFTEFLEKELEEGEEYLPSVWVKPRRLMLRIGLEY